jgi:hypothetical protein
VPELGLQPKWMASVDGFVARVHPQRIAIDIGGQQAVVFVPERADVTFRRFIGPE